MNEVPPKKMKLEEDSTKKGFCKIKPEFIIEYSKRVSPDNPPKEGGEVEKEIVKDDDDSETRSKKFKRSNRKDKPKGQNKARPPPFRTCKENNLCPSIIDQGVDDPEKKCPLKKCIFIHDREAYMKLKEPEISSECYIFNQTGKCPRGIACRFSKNHVTETGLNIMDKEKYEEYQSKPSSTTNKLTGALQDRLRKHKYDFKKTEEITEKCMKSQAKDSSKEINKTEDLKVEENVNEVKNGETGEETIKELPLGPVPDDDLIKLRPAEKKKIDWRDKILLSPLTTVGNLPFRRICKEFGADITCGEMALAPNILKGTREEWALVKRHESEDIFGAQICGNNSRVLTRCAQLLNEETDVDFIDLNLGCPIDLIYKQGAGSGMLNRGNILQAVVTSVSQVLNIPLTIKTRMGVYMDKPIAHNLMPKFRDWGASMITIHGRSREQRYTKSADWDYIGKCAEAAAPVPVFGNGDILCYDDYQTMKNRYPNIQGVTIGRGALIKPWIFSEFKEKKLIDISSKERLDILQKYANYGLEHWGSDTRGVETTRRFMLEWLSFLHRYIPVGILMEPPQRINERPPFFKGRDDLETLMASSNCADWVKISEMFLGKVPDGFHFLPKHKANSWS